VNPLRNARVGVHPAILSPTLLALNRDSFVIDLDTRSTVALEHHRSDSSLRDINLGDDVA